MIRLHDHGQDKFVDNSSVYYKLTLTFLQLGQDQQRGILKKNTRHKVRYEVRAYSTGYATTYSTGKF